MKKIVSLAVGIMTAVYADDVITISAAESACTQPQAVRIYCGILTPKERIKNITEIIKKDIERSGQCLFDVCTARAPHQKKDITTLFDEGYPLAVFIDECTKSDRVGIEWRLYDAISATMIKGVKQELQEGSCALQAHAIALPLAKELLGVQVPCLTRIAYIKRGKDRLGKRQSHVCTSDWLGADERVLLSSSRILVAPSFQGIDGAEQLFFSEFTPYNVRCMKLEKNGTKMPLFDLEGTCVGISCGSSASAVYCRSGALWKYQYDAEKKRGVHERLVYKDQPCSHPTLCANGDIIFCSGGSLYRFDGKSRALESLTQDGYCVAPDFHEQENALVYSQRINGVMQLVVLSPANGEREQLTFDAGDKVDPRWSPCGNYIVYACEMGRASRIAVIHRHTRVKQHITPEGVHCAYPAWSSFGSIW